MYVKGSNSVTVFIVQSIVIVGSWLTHLIYPTAHIHSRLANQKPRLTLIPHLARVQSKSTTASFPKTCIPSLQHITVNLPGNNCQSSIPVPQIRSSWHRKPFPQGRDTAKKAQLDRNFLQSRIRNQSRLHRWAKHYGSEPAHKPWVLCPGSGDS